MPVLRRPVEPARDTGKVRKEPQVLLSRSELDGNLGRSSTDVGEKVRLSARHDSASLPGPITCSWPDTTTLMRPYSHREMLVHASGGCAPKSVASTGAALAQEAHRSALTVGSSTGPEKMKVSLLKALQRVRPSLDGYSGDH